ncbi:hypothetical protein CERZMDRAFT_97973 [Cercospora zeae-maydis SCOH1-5]|uniref:Uncharacterized protein n=1 Tax=Cercospora zeae-maydis SCOH1-5 TaxID=717836 RepID=A0A6A6FFP5_9PEZI|nr:hypothetical protein CERZMDRAFT_97973 [Cercospora zeae-maydis SCOH1-5]
MSQDRNNTQNAWNSSTEEPATDLISQETQEHKHAPAPSQTRTRSQGICVQPLLDKRSFLRNQILQKSSPMEPTRSSREEFERVEPEILIVEAEISAVPLRLRTRESG